MSEILSKPVHLDKFFLFAAATFVAGQYNPTQRIKMWRDDGAKGDEDTPYTYLGLAIDKADPMGRPLLDASGNPYLKTYMMAATDASTANVPPNVANFARVPAPAWPVPIDPSRWDAENYFLRTHFLDDIPWVHDRRGVTLTQEQMIAAIYEAVVLGKK